MSTKMVQKQGGKKVAGKNMSVAPAKANSKAGKAVFPGKTGK